ncbi:hypothetical protein IscW_ISCW000827 [Ixodes scapularis]|uniref:Uncharacterized protein n=1 Tax=Ixodes scapularis TaxID=6945 RepID=B7P3A3_IXOSC|nr:hypothetical protein IscW_ISCW000827 [Ixodes scapularis]|eukprot:XP_002403772.1 hypothetical protein IscW_ISCW000827 [Ixodes scapularis]
MSLGSRGPSGRFSRVRGDVAGRAFGVDRGPEQPRGFRRGPAAWENPWPGGGLGVGGAIFTASSLARGLTGAAAKGLADRAPRPLVGREKKSAPPAPPRSSGPLMAPARNRSPARPARQGPRTPPLAVQHGPPAKCRTSLRIPEPEAVFVD